MAYKGVFFDLGGTLFSYKDVPMETFGITVKALRKMGCTEKAPVIGKNFLAASKVANARMMERPYYLHRDLFRETLVEVVDKMALTWDEGVAQEYFALQLEGVVTALKIREDCKDTLKHLKSEGLYLSIVSNIDDDYLIPLVERNGLDSLLDHWTSSEEAQSCKPDPGFFKYALEKSNCKSEEVIFVGDSPEHDIAGANLQGMTSVLIQEKGIEPPMQRGFGHATPAHTISQLAELKGIVRGETA